MEYKKIYYFVNPKFFKDGNHDGFGDLLGLAKQTHYFKLLNVNSLIISDIFNHDLNILPFSTIKTHLGTEADFKIMIDQFKQQAIDVILELPLSVLGHNYLWLKKAEALATNNLTRELYLYEELTKEISLNSDQTLLTNLIDIMSFWLANGVKGFVFKDFEYLGDINKTEVLSYRTLKLLKEAYLRIKSLNKNCFLIGYSQKLTYKTLLNFTHGLNKVFDKVISNQVAHLNLKSKDQRLLPNFNSKTLVKLLKKVINHSKANLTFSTFDQGRLISRWGNDLAFWKEAGKCLALLFYLNKNHNQIFFGDELGLPNLWFESPTNINDQTIKHHNRIKQSQGIKKKKIISHNKMHHHKHTKQTIPWNSKFNGGFSSKESNNSLTNHRFQEINVSNQILDQSSIFDFHRKLIALTNSKFFQKLCKYGTFSISLKANGIIVIKAKNHFDKIKAYVNLSLKTKSLMFSKSFDSLPVVLSTYNHANYNHSSLKLRAYEGIILLKTSKDYFKNQKDFINVQEKKPNQSTIKS